MFSYGKATLFLIIDGIFFSDFGLPPEFFSDFVKKSEILKTFCIQHIFFINVLLDSERDLKCVAQALSAVYKNTKNGCCALIKPTFSP